MDVATKTTDAETVDIGQLEGLAGLVADLTNSHITRTAANLEEAVRQRCGPGVTLADVRAVFETNPI